MNKQVEKKYSRSHIGEAFITNEGYTGEVVDGGKVEGTCTVKIGKWVSQVIYSTVKRGSIHNPYHPSLLGIGYKGEGAYNIAENGKHTVAYIKWKSMFMRCYSEEHLKKYPTYNDVTVCKEWHNFQNFAKWFHEDSNYQEGWHLDKDLLAGDVKAYSPVTCVFIPEELNTFLIEQLSTNTSGYRGVSWCNDTKKWRALLGTGKKRQSLGRFDSKEKAYNAYSEARAIKAAEYREIFKSILPATALKHIK